MAGGNRSKSEKNSVAHSQDNSAAQKKTPKSGANGTGALPGAQGSPSGSCAGLLFNALFYLALIGAAGFAAFYVQQAVDEIRQMGAKYGEDARQGAELSTKMESVFQQVGRKKKRLNG